MNKPSSSTDSVFDAIVEEFLTERDRGGNPDPRRYVERYPDQAERLERFFLDWNKVNVYVEAAKSEIAASQPGAATDGDGNGNGDAYIGTGDQFFGPYRVIATIGKGTQGVVYKAAQPGTKRHVALKVLRDGILASGAARRRFETEVQSVGRLNHPNIVAIYECGQGAGHAYYAMELVEGKRIDRFVRDQGLSVRATVELFLQVGDALAYAHQQGVIHRDLKPSNILVDAQGRARVLDFGLAKLADAGDANVTMTGQFTGTFAYAAPEQLIGSKAVDARADVYALGLILYQLLADTLPYEVDSTSERRLYDKIMELPFPSPARFRVGIPRDLATIILTALKKSADDRYQTAAALAHDLRRFLRGEPIDARRDSRWYLLRATARYYRWPLIAAATAIVLLLGFTATITVLYSKARTAQATAEARARMSRAGQAFLYRRLLRLNLLDNTLDAVQLEHPESRAAGRATRPELELPAEVMEVLNTAPEALFTSSAADAQPTAETGRWLEAHAAALDSIAAQLDGGALTFAYHNLSADYVASATVSEFYWAQRLSGLYLARALMDVSRDDLDAASRNLESARQVAQDLADGPRVSHKNGSIFCRREQFGTVLHVLGKLAASEHDLDPLLEWIERDPPLPALKPALIHDRMRWFQFAEAALVETVPGGPGHLDLDLLNRITAGYYQNIGYLTAENRAAATTISAEEIVSLLDASADRPESVRWRSGEPAPLILGALLSSTAGAQRAIQFTESMRAACLVTARLCRFRGSHGRFPAALAELGEVPNDTATGLPFGYSPSPAVTLYSLNLDGIDHGGKCGRIGDADTDIPLFIEAGAGDQPCPIGEVHYVPPQRVE